MAPESQSADRSSAPLAGVRVAEFGKELSVPYAGKLLADLGATVVKVETADGGDPSRQFGPFAASAGGGESSGMFAYLNTGKRSVTRESIGAVGDGSDLGSILQWADIALVDRPWLRAEPELEPGRAVEQAPHLAFVTVTPYGTTGPYADWPATDLTISALSGMSVGVGERDRAPLVMPFFQCEMNGGLFGALAAVNAAMAVRRDGRGQHVDVSTADIMASMFTGYFLPRFIYGGGLVGIRAGRNGASMPYPGTIFRSADGLVRTDTPQVAQWIRLVKLMGTPEWSKEPRYRNRRAMQWEYKQESDALVEPWFMARTKEELGELFLEHRLPYAPLLTAEDMEHDPHLAEREAIASLPTSDGTTRFSAPAAPYRFSGQRPASHPAPTLGSSDDELPSLISSEQPERELPPTAEDRATAAPPLQGFRVIDLGTAWAGGLAGRLLADYGADVLKIESWVHMDGSRLGKPIVVEDDTGGDEGKWPDLQPGFHVHSRNKRSITLNLKTDAGRSVLLRLVREADALIHNFPAGVMDRLGLSDDALHAANERLVVVGQNVAGSEGPKSGLIGYAGAVSALSGLANWVGYEGEDPIGMFEGLYGDVVSATTTTFATLVGLLDRDLHRRANASIDVSQWEASLALAGEGLIAQSLGGETPASVGTHHPRYFPHGNFASAGHDQWVAVAVRSPREWRALCRLVGREDLAPLESVEARRERADEVTDAIEAWTRGVGSEEAAYALVAAGIPAAPVLNIADIFGNEHFRARDLFIDVEHPLVGSEPMTGMPWKMSRTPGRVSRRAPLLGEHTAEVVKGMAGVSDEEYRGLVDAGGIETGPPEGRN